MKSFRSDDDTNKGDVINNKNFETIHLEGDIYPIWYNQRIRNNYQHLFDLLERKKYIYNRAGDYYRKNEPLLCNTIYSYYNYI